MKGRMGVGGQIETPPIHEKLPSKYPALLGLNITCLFFSSACHAIASGPATVIVINPLTTMYPSL